MVSAFGIILYGISFIGSFSLGYILLRTAFPEKQKLLPSQKLEYGYAIGVPIIILSSIFGEKYFFFVFAFLSVLLFAIALAKRLSLKEADFVAREQVKRKIIIPEKALTKEEREALKTGQPLPGRTQRQTVTQAQPQKRIVASQIQPVNEVRKGQVFIEGNNNILSQVEANTATANDESKEKAKRAILDRLKMLAKDVKKSEPLEREKNSNDDMQIEDLNFE